MIGINLSGAEFGSGLRHGTDYHYPDANELAYYASRGVELVRLPFTWERMQHSLGGPLVPEELARMKTFLADAAALGVSVIIDLHNYGRYNGNTIGSSSVSYEQFASFWAKLANELKNAPALVGYDIMNEPHDMNGAHHWPAAAQAAVNAIRSVDMQNTIYVEGDNWSGAASWLESNANLIINDPANNLIYEAHLYFDRYGEGIYRTDYATDGAYANIGVDRLKPFTDWLAQHNLKGFIGEFGVPGNDPQWLEVQSRFLEAMKVAGLSGTAWGGGFWWPNDYALRLGTPGGGDTLALEQLKKYMDGDVVVVAPTPLPTPPPPPPVVIDPGLIAGTEGSDTLNGTSGKDRMDGAGGNDVLRGSGEPDVISGGAGIDTIDYGWSGARVDVDLMRAFQGGGDAQDDQLTAIENIVGSGHADILAGNHSANSISSGNGADLLLGRGGADRLDGGGGVDTASYAGSNLAVDVDLMRAAQWGGHAEGDTLSSIENLTGSSFGDRLSGDMNANRLSGGDGDDVLTGRGGADVMSGGAGRDRFVFTNIDDVRGDWISDFGSGDMLDFGAIDANVTKAGDQAFSLIGNRAFNGAAGQLRSYTENGTTYVAGDTNGDRIADFTLSFNGTYQFGSSDMIF